MGSPTQHPEHVGAIQSLMISPFAVGPQLQNITKSVTLPSGRREMLGMYWIGEAPYESAPLFKSLSDVFAGMAIFFNDESEPFFKIFIRRSTSGSFGGSAFYRTFVIEYYPGMIFTYSDFIFLFSYELVHNWPRLGKCNRALAVTQEISDFKFADLSCDNITQWFNEGIADYYGIILPQRLGVFNDSIFTDGLNSKAQAYYTNSAIDMSNKEAQERFWSGFDVTRLPYSRGFVYLIAVDAKIRRASNGSRSIDNVVIELVARQNAGKNYGIDVFLSLVLEEVPSAIVDYEAMASAKQLQIPAVDSFASLRLTLDRFDMPPFEPAFLIGPNRTISYVAEGSRAAEAGLKMGHRVVQMSNFNWVAGRLDRNMTVRVIESEQDAELDIVFWPRARHTVEGYQWRKMA